VPSAIVVLDALPLTPHGKLDRRALPPPDVAGTAADGYTPPRTAAERIFADVWAEVLGVERVGIHDNFFELGGDSIRSIKVLAVARRRGIDVSLQDLFQHQTIAGIAPAQSAAAGVAEAQAFALLTEGERRSVIESHPDAVDAYPLTRLQQGMLFQRAFRQGTAAYHNVSSFHLRVPFDEPALRRAVEGLVARHPALRSSLHPSGFDRPVQVVHQAVPVPFELHDLRGLNAEAQRVAVDASFAAERVRRFDWTIAPQFRLVVHVRRDNVDGAPRDRRWLERSHGALGVDDGVPRGRWLPAAGTAGRPSFHVRAIRRARAGDRHG
jgi:aryl carrier-like protein